MNSEQLSELIHAHASKLAEKAVQPLLDRIAQLEARPVEKGDPGTDGEDGAPGRDGVAPTAEEVAACYERRFSEFLLSGERRIHEMADKAIDRMPRAKDGDPGKDGRDFEPPEFDYDGRRQFVIRSTVNGEPREQTFRLPIVIDAGFYSEGSAYEKGDAVTFGGSTWIAQEDTSAKPEIGQPEWRLAVKKGRDRSRSVG